MKSMLIVFFVILLIFFILIFPFKIRLMGHLDLVKMKGFYCFKVLGIKFLNGRIYMENGEIKAENSINFMDGKINKDYMVKLSQEIISRIDVKKTELYFTGGTLESSFSSAIMCGSISSFVETLYSILSLKFDNVKLYSDIKPTFNENNFELTFDVAIAISLLKILISIFSALIKLKQKKESKNEG